MKFGFYPKLAFDGIRKNKRLYGPYLLTCVGMVMMYYIVAFLCGSPVMKALPGGATIRAMLDFGSGVMALFALIFLFYTNSFLIRRRKKEFGLYNILGMGKGSIGKILFWETLLTMAVALLGGIGVGVGLSKLFELGLVNLMNGEVSFDFYVSFGSINRAVLIFGTIFLLLFLNSLRQIRLSNPIALLRSESTGEKPPKANWVLGIAGAVILAAAYYTAVVIRDPLTALGWFFIAVAMVIVATYLLFVAGSVVLCRLLQKSKRFYYKANHFVSVSSMAYRMKRNGAGLASICILLTMVLVMLSSTAALYIGAEDILNNRYPRDITVDLDMWQTQGTEDETVSRFRDSIQSVLDEHGARGGNVYDYRTASISGLLTDGYFQADISALAEFSLDTYSNVVQLYLVPLSDYNRLTGEAQSLEPGEVLVYPYRTGYTVSTFQVAGGDTYRVKAVVDTFPDNGNAAMIAIPSVYVFVPNLEAAVAPLETLADYNGDRMIRFHWYYGFDLELPTGEQIDIYNQIRNSDWRRGITDADVIYSSSVECREANRNDFYGTFGGLLFLGLMLSIVFLAAAVLIIYYKQISEGYEDQARFEIMQKVGMTRQDIRKSINSQMLTVFFLPLVTAGVHLCFAFPMVRKLLLLFNLTNTPLLIATTAASFLIFGLFYAVVYKITSNAYFTIVSGAKDA